MKRTRRREESRRGTLRACATLLLFVWVGRAQEACRVCHAGIAASYARTGMARSFGAAPEVARGTFRHEASEQSFSLISRGAQNYLRRESGGGTLEKPVDYWIGSGDHARSYLTRTASGDLAELPVTWYAEGGGHWGMSPGYSRPDHAGFSRKIAPACLFCHTAYPEGEGQPRQGIDCQRCHGPGKAHIEAAEGGASAEAIRASIVNPARLDAARRMEVCLQCHLETTSLRLPPVLKRFDREVYSYRPGEPLADYEIHFDRPEGSEVFEFSSAPYRLRKSACFLKSGGKLTCTTCHNPHDATARQYTPVCRTCHTGALSAQHPVGNDCISCHMVKRRPSDAVQVTVTDHFIRKRPDAEPAGKLVERNDGNVPAYRGPVIPYYPPNLPRTAENELYVAVAQVAHQANLTLGIPILEAAIAKASPARADFYLELAEACRHDGQAGKATRYYEEAIARAPADWRAYYGLGNTLAATGDLPRSVQILERAAELAPRDATPLQGLAKALQKQGKEREAAAALRKAVEVDPESAEALNDLGTALFRLGDRSGAEKAMREAIRLRPEIIRATVR